MSNLSFLEENYAANEWVSTMVKYPDSKVKNFCYTRNELMQLKLTQHDSYMTLNTIQFKDGKIKRDQEHVRRLKFLYMDLDTYNTDFTNTQILMNLQENYFGQTIPNPSYVISSGRGMYLLWSINEHVNALPRWKKVQRYLYEQLQEFGADSHITEDYARLFRIVGSRNSKSNSKVEIISSSAEKYTLYEIMEEYGITGQKVKKDKKAEGRFIPFDKANRLYTSRIQDLRNLLLNYRDKEDSGRENILFLYRYYQLCLHQNLKGALASTLKLNAKLIHPLSEKEVIRATKSAEEYFLQGEKFKITSSGMIDFLSLTAEEIAAMPCILTDERMKERKAKNNHAYYKAALKRTGKALKRETIFKRRKRIYELVKKGLSNPEIVKILGISRSTYFVDRKVVDLLIEAMKEPQRAISGLKNVYQQLVCWYEETGLIMELTAWESGISNERNGPKIAMQI